MDVPQIFITTANKGEPTCPAMTECAVSWTALDAAGNFPVVDRDTFYAINGKDLTSLIYEANNPRATIVANATGPLQPFAAKPLTDADVLAALR